ncbi:sulfatase-like hydrolase/transferase [Paenibacillus puerhi]|uniref:sulfatase-like hydrolase/transferase n=1 Tax=Paenibacillus puerhi TaxID=2692622 RepID=UPI001357474D|nr:sulfatase-like hydrolase/transferase [Paenibacillus puerhi]
MSCDTPGKRPNILVLITDQQRADTITSDTPCEMPNMDMIKKKGVQFKRAYTTNAICSPARASLMTGLYPSRHGMVDCTHTVEPYRADLKPNLPMWSQQLRESGYTGGYFGKWHVERTEKLDTFGFDRYLFNDSEEYKSYRNGLGMEVRNYIDKKVVHHNGYRDRIFYGVHDEPEEASEPYFLYQQGISFIQDMASSDKPWFSVISTLEPHDPFIVPKAFYDKYDPEKISLPESYDDDLQNKPGLYRRLKSVWKDLSETDVRKAIACYYASCSLIDSQIGRILQALSETGQLDNTYIIFTSDHGELLGAHGLFLKGVPAYEEVYNIPLVISGPHIEPTVSEAFVSLVDLAPTICEVTGSNVMPLIDGSSLQPLLTGEADLNAFPWNEAYAEFHGQRFFYTQRIVWHDKFKYIFNGFDFDELYDLQADPDERVNLAENQDYSDILEEMAKRMWRRVYRLGDYNMAKSDYGMFCFAPVGPDFEEHEFQLIGPDSQ